MGLSNLRKNHTVNRGHKGITNHGRRIVRQGAFILENRVGKSDLSFLTCTLPGGTVEDCKAANAAWPEITRRFMQDIRRELARRGAPTWVIGCTEIQPERFKRTGQPWPHMHLVFTGRTGRPWLIGKMRANELWARCVMACLPIDRAALSWATRIEPIKTKKSVAQYLSKYLSKGGEEIERLANSDDSHPLPRAWHHCSHDLNQLVKKGVAQLHGQTAAWVIKLLQEKYPGSKLWAEICPTPTIDCPHDAPIGYVGCLDPPLADRVRRYNAKIKARTITLKVGQGTMGLQSTLEA